MQDSLIDHSQSISLSRRQFLRAGTGAALGLGLGLPSLLSLTGCASRPVSSTPAWSELAARLQGTLLMPGSPGFAARAQPWALQYASTLPQGIAQCAGEADVQTCLQWAQANRVPLVARSGGHSYAGNSTTTGLMVDVSPMNGVEINAATGIAVVGGGARNKNVYAACRPYSRAVTHGRCKDVGVAGLVLGGGIGFNMRAQGLTCDQLVETRVVLADGRALTCNRNENTELFWACRGAGGGNYGIHTSFTFQTFPVSTLTVFEMSWTERLADVFAALQAVALAAPETLGMKLSVVARAGAQGLKLSILGQFVGPKEALLALFAPVLARYRPVASTVELLPYWDAQEFLSEDGAPEYSHERSRFAKGALSGEAIEMILANLSIWPGTTVAGTWKFFLMGGKINDRSPTDMAFVHRGYSMISSVELEWTASDSAEVLAKNQQWLTRFHDRMERYTSSYCYQNFIDPSQRDYLHAYYGENLPRLQAAKRKYDPTDVFRYPQSIPV
jgi:FAD/FMN-containing dehydrogenase